MIRGRANDVALTRLTEVNARAAVARLPLASALPLAILQSAMAGATMAGIKSLARLIAEKFCPEKILLFGSYSRGEESPDSDVDLLVIMRTDLRNSDQAVAIARVLPRPFPIDIVVYGPEEIERRLSGGDTVLEDMLEEGVVLYEAYHEGVAGKGRG